DKERPSRVYYDLPKDTFAEIETLIGDLKIDMQQHNKDAENFDREDLVRQISELKAKKWASGYIQSIKDEILQLKKKHEVDEWLRSVNTTAVSKEAGRVSEVL